MYNVPGMTSSHVSAIAALFGLLMSHAGAGDYKPLPGSFRPPSHGDASIRHSGFPPVNNPTISTPSQQQAWTSQPYGTSSNYYLPAPQVAPQYPQQHTANDTWNRSINVNPGSMFNNMYGPGSSGVNNEPPTYYQQPAYQPPTQQVPAYPQTYHYGSTYPHPERYSYAVPPVQSAQPPAAAPASPPANYPAPFTSRPFAGEDMRFRPPELKGSD